MNASDKKALHVSILKNFSQIHFVCVCVKFLNVGMWQTMCQCQLNSGTVILPSIEYEKASFKNILLVSLTHLS